MRILAVATKPELPCILFLSVVSWGTNDRHLCVGWCTGESIYVALISVVLINTPHGYPVWNEGHTIGNTQWLRVNAALHCLPPFSMESYGCDLRSVPLPSTPSVQVLALNAKLTTTKHLQYHQLYSIDLFIPFLFITLLNTKGQFHFV